MSGLLESAFLGDIAAASYKVEFTPCGLPVARIILTRRKESKYYTYPEIDGILSDEIPDEKLYPHLYEIVTRFMVRQPCNHEHLDGTLCFDGYDCRYCFPKNYGYETQMDDSGSLCMRRRWDHESGVKGGFVCDNRHVIPYNRRLLLHYQTYIRVHFCDDVSSIREILHCRRTASNDLGSSIIISQLWEGLGYLKEFRTFGVMKLSFHRPGQNILRGTVCLSNFLAWMSFNNEYDEAKDLTYSELLSKFEWHVDLCEWKPRRSGCIVGQLNYAHPASGEIYYLRVILTVRKGDLTYEDLMVVDGVRYSTFKAACIAMGMVEDS